MVLDRLQDAGNVGSILRSASAFGFTQIAAVKGAAALWSAKVLRAGMGAHFALRLYADVDLAELVARYDGTVYAAAGDAETAVYDVDLTGRVALLFGNEGAGISAPLRRAAKTSISIPMSGKAESLNVAAAAAVCLFERVRQMARKA